ncbi:DUF4446 family protein [Nocardioides massiliensis]|uniref:DUF4446 family protein n=1 Tax=Nocardioides massiliensis TaxID=1325935 RepID=A0ABT9NLC9_9ACTN|nr:DUF4446 family protein [Nocardioides massiliensis]MDP9821226.1 hypothetical protein [Nocardioides massiliensis]
MNESLLVVVSLCSLVLAVVALVVALTVSRRTAKRGAGDDTDAVPADVQGLRQEVSALRVEVSDALRHLSVVRYDAFGDMGGHLSWSVALLDDAGSGIVLTSIHGRSEARTYAKNVANWTSDAVLSPEEQEAISAARPR